VAALVLKIGKREALLQLGAHTQSTLCGTFNYVDSLCAMLAPVVPLLSKYKERAGMRHLP
jgi:hypothetical protein